MAVYFLWHFPSVNLADKLPACIPEWSPGYTASRPVVFGLSSPGESTSKAILHPSKINWDNKAKKSENQGDTSALVVDRHLKDHVGGEIEDHPAVRTKIDTLPMLAVNDHLRRQFHVAMTANGMLDT